MRERQAEGEGDRKRPQREEGEGWKGPQASCNLWRGIKERGAGSMYECVHPHHREKQEATQHPPSVSHRLCLYTLIQCVRE